MKIRLLLCVLLSGYMSFGQMNFEDEYQEIEAKVIEWRRDFHQNPELSNREFKTAEKIAAHLESLGIEVQTGVAKTGANCASFN